MTGMRSGNDSQHDVRRAFRFDRIRLAFFTSVASKGLGLLVQLLAVPLAVKALGTERFGLYTMLVSALVWIDLGRFGIGPGLTRDLAVAWNKNNRETEKALFSSAFFFLIAVALVIGSSLALIFSLQIMPLERFVGSSAIQYRSEIMAGAFVVMTVLLLQIVFSVGESARSAYQEDYINNTMNGIGNLLSVVLVVGVAVYWPTIQGFAIAVFGSLALGKGINLSLLIGKSRCYLRPRWHQFTWHAFKPLLHSSMAFWLIQLAILMMHNFSLLELGSLIGPEAMAPFAVLFRFLQLLSTVVLMMTMPLWPAITDAVVRADHKWIQRSYWRLLRAVMIYSVCVAIAVGLAGHFLIRMWVGKELHIEAALYVMMGIYFVIWMWNHSHTTILFGLGRLWSAAFSLLAEGSLVLVLGGILVPRLGNLGMALSMVVAGLITSAWILPLLTRNKINGLSGG